MEIRWNFDQTYSIHLDSDAAVILDKAEDCDWFFLQPGLLKSADISKINVNLNIKNE